MLGGKRQRIDDLFGRQAEELLRFVRPSIRGGGSKCGVGERPLRVMSPLSNGAWACENQWVSEPASGYLLDIGVALLTFLLRTADLYNRVRDPLPDFFAIHDPAGAGRHTIDGVRADDQPGIGWRRYAGVGRLDAAVYHSGFEMGGYGRTVELGKVTDACSDARWRRRCHWCCCLSFWCFHR
jgi:hypothetical protein